jgi:hypothetical protein
MFLQMLLALYLCGMAFSAFFFGIVLTSHDNRHISNFDRFVIWCIFTIGWFAFLGMYIGYHSVYLEDLHEEIEYDSEEEKEYVSTFAFAECPSCGHMEKEWKKGE